MSATFHVFRIHGNPIGLGAKVLSNVPIAEKNKQKPVDKKGKSQTIQRNTFFRGNKRNT